MRKKFLGLTCIVIQSIMVLRHQGGNRLARKSRADYFKQRRDGKKNFGALIDRKKAEAMEAKLNAQNVTKTQWLNEKIDDELKK